MHILDALANSSFNQSEIRRGDSVSRPKSHYIVCTGEPVARPKTHLIVRTGVSLKRPKNRIIRLRYLCALRVLCSWIFLRGLHTQTKDQT